MIHVAIKKREEMPVNSKKQAEIRALLFDKALTEIPAEYSDYSNIFSAENAVKILKNTGINEHAIKLGKDKQPHFNRIYSLEPIELETLKTYIKTNLANDFIWPSKSPIEAPIFYDRKPDKSFYFCVDYLDLNNITINNRYPLPLIGESLNWLNRIKRFI